MDVKPYRYHPIRWEFLRPSDEYDDFCYAYDHDDLTEAETQEAGGPEAIEKIMECAEITWSFIEDFEKAGRHIYHLEPDLVRMFRKTSVDEVPIDLLASPYDCIFIYFGPEGKIYHPADGRVIDGAYVRLSGDVFPESEDCLLWIYLCPEFPDLTSAKSMSMPERLRLDQGYRHLVLSSELGTVGDAYSTIFQTYDERVSEFEHYRIQKIMKQAGIIKERTTYTDAKADSWVDPEDALWKGHDKEAVNLVVNALAFLTARPEDVEFNYTDDAPIDLVRKASDLRSQKQSLRAESKLEALGYRRVYTCGRRYRNAVTQEDGESQGTHWRRGHWRNQAHGSGREERRLVWIEPVLVNGRGDTVTGRVHVTKEKQ